MNLRFYLLSFLFFSCSVLQNNNFVYRAENLSKGNTFVYALPFTKGQSFYVLQGYESLFSHRGDYAVDFKMKRGTPVLSARSGRVIFVRQTDTKGGVGKRFVGTGNGITIQHNDGTYAHYWHLQHNGVLVAVGDSVQVGQHIAFSGNTGFSAFPHLHFEVTRKSTKSEDDFPVRFQTAGGAQFLKPLRRYKAL